MMNGIKHTKKFNNVIQILYYIFILLLREKTNIQLLSQIQEQTI